MSPPKPLWSTVVLALLLAGCSAKPTHTVEVEPGQVITVEQPVDPGNGIVSGIVGDDAVYPLKGALITVAGLGLNTTTDANGRFTILDVPPGIYLLQGEEKNHATTQTTVEVQGGKVARAVLLLPRIPPTDPYHTTFSADMQTDFSFSSVVAGNQTDMNVNLDASKRATLILESKWDGTVVSPDDTPLTYDLMKLDRTSVVSAQATNPFTVRIDPRVLPPAMSDFIFDVQPTFGDTLVVESRGQSFVTIFYNQPAPDGWSILSGST